MQIIIISINKVYWSRKNYLLKITFVTFSHAGVINSYNFKISVIIQKYVFPRKKKRDKTNVINFSFVSVIVIIFMKKIFTLYGFIFFFFYKINS